jgi:hypothetical protein
MSSNIPASTEAEIHDDISGLADDTRRRDSFSLSFARVLIGGTLVPKRRLLPDGLGMYFDRVSPMPSLREGTFDTFRLINFAARDNLKFSSRRGSTIHGTTCTVLYCCTDTKYYCIGLSINTFSMSCRQTYIGVSVCHRNLNWGMPTVTPSGPESQVFTGRCGRLWRFLVFLYLCSSFIAAWLLQLLLAVYEFN